MNIHVVYLVLTFFVGILYIYINNTQPKIIIRKPMIDDNDDTLYIDENQVCHKYTISEEECPTL